MRDLSIKKWSVFGYDHDTIIRDILLLKQINPKDNLLYPANSDGKSLSYKRTSLRKRYMKKIIKQVAKERLRDYIVPEKAFDLDALCLDLYSDEINDRIFRILEYNKTGQLQ